MSNYNYAVLGRVCETNFDMLTSNEKILSPYDKIYQEKNAKMYRYPGSSKPLKTTNLSRPEDLKREGNSQKINEDYSNSSKGSSGPSMKSCCGN